MPTTQPVGTTADLSTTQISSAQSAMMVAVSSLISTITNSLPAVVASIGVNTNNLQNEFADMTTVYDNASINLAKAEKNYILSTEGGVSNYNTLLNTNISGELDEVEYIIIDDYKNHMNFIDQIAKQFKSEISSLRNARTGYDNLLIENAILTKKLDAYSKILNTNERKTVYELQNMKNLYLYRRVLFFIYYLLIAVYIFFGDFIPKKLYTDYTYSAVLLIIIIFPFILNTIISWTIMCINALHFWLDDSIIKDVYDELDKTT